MSDKSFKRILRASCHRESSCDELSALEAQFRNAYIKKALDAQLAEKQTEKLAEQAQEKLSLRLIAAEREKYNEELMIKKSEDLKNREKYKQSLEQQIISKELIKRNEIEAAIVERNVLEEVDELMDKVHQLAKQKHRDFYVKKMRREQLLFEEIRAVKKAISEEKEIKAAEREALYLKEIEQRSQERKIQREHQIKCRETLIEEVAKFFLDVTVEKREREAVIADIVAEERMHEAMAQECEYEYKKQKARQELTEDLRSQIILSNECKSRAKERDRLFVKEVMARVMEEERLEQLTAEARRRKQEQYKEELEKLIRDKARMRNEMFRRKMEEESDEMKMRDQIIKQKIKEGRRRLIAEHAGNVVGYLRDGILSHDEQNIVRELLEKCKTISQ